MTKAEFYANIETVSELVSFCERFNCYHIVEDLRESNDFDAWIWDQMDELSSHWYWTELRDTLAAIDTPMGDYFLPGENLSYSEIDDEDLENYKDQVVDYLDDGDFWDDEGDDEWISDDDPIEDKESGDVCWDVSVDLSVLIGAG